MLSPERIVLRLYFTDRITLEIEKTINPIKKTKPPQLKSNMFRNRFPAKSCITDDASLTTSPTKLLSPDLNRLLIAGNKRTSHAPNGENFNNFILPRKIKAGPDNANKITRYDSIDEILF